MAMVPRKDKALVSEIARQLTAWIATVRLKHAARDVTGHTELDTGSKCSCALLWAVHVVRSTRVARKNGSTASALMSKIAREIAAGIATVRLAGRICIPMDSLCVLIRLRCVLQRCISRSR